MNSDTNSAILQERLENLHLIDDDDGNFNSKISIDQLANHLKEFEMALDENGNKSKKSRLESVWIPEQKLSLLTSAPNKKIEKMGLRTSGKIFLLPEETLFLLQLGELCLTYSDQVVKVEDAFILLGINLNRFLVYSQLKQNGYIIAHAQAKFKCPQPFDPSILKLPPPHAFEAWKPRPHFKLSQPPPPDFRIFIESEKESALIVPKIIPEGPGSAILALSDQGLPVFYEIQMLGSNFTPNTTEKSLPKYSTINVSD